jgi:hypothetical protein
MLSKCANPACSLLFRYSSQGRIFRLEMWRKAAASSIAEFGEFQPSTSRWTEFFWLCAECSRNMVVLGDCRSRFRVQRVAASREMVLRTAA